MFNHPHTEITVHSKRLQNLGISAYLDQLFTPHDVVPRSFSFAVSIGAADISLLLLRRIDDMLPYLVAPGLSSCLSNSREQND